MTTWGRILLAALSALAFVALSASARQDGPEKPRAEYIPISVTFNPTSISPGGDATTRVTIQHAADAPGQTESLEYVVTEKVSGASVPIDQALVNPPSTLFVASGLTYAEFVLRTRTYPRDLNIVVKATSLNTTRTGTIATTTTTSGGY